MQPRRVSNPRDPALTPFTTVRDPELLLRHGLFVAESKPVVRAALASRFRVRSVLLNERAWDELSPVLTAYPHPLEVFVAADALLVEVVGFPMHRGALALAERGTLASVDEVLGAAQRVVGLIGISDPDNVGTIFRTARAFGVDALVLDETSADPLYRKAIRTSMGHSLALPWTQLGDGVGVVDTLKRVGFSVDAFTPTREAERLSQVVPAARRALLFGNEGVGLPAAVCAAADHRLRIPIALGIDSLNVAAAVAIALYDDQRLRTS